MNTLFFTGKSPICVTKVRGMEAIPSSSKTLAQSNDNNPVLPPKMCKISLQKRSNSYYKSNLPNKMSLKSHSPLPKTELNIPVATSYSGIINLEKTQNNVSEAKSYMLSKHQNNKSSILDDVVSKVPAVITLPSLASESVIEQQNTKGNYNPQSSINLVKCATLPKLLKISNRNDFKKGIIQSKATVSTLLLYLTKLVL